MAPSNAVNDALVSPVQFQEEKQGVLPPENPKQRVLVVVCSFLWVVGQDLLKSYLEVNLLHRKSKP